MTHKKLAIGVLTLGLLAGSAGSFASGSFSGAGSSGVQSGYNQGKVILHKKLICNSCPLAMSGLDKMGAMKIMEKVKGNSKEVQMLTHRERKAVGFYISKRFKIK